MGKQRFRLSHMIPNAWFYKLKDMNPAAAAVTAPRNKNPVASTSNQPRNSLCYTPKVYSSPSNRNTITRPPMPKHVLGSIYIRPDESTHTNQDLFLSPTSSCYESPLFEFNDTSYAKRGQDSCGYELIKDFELQKPPRIKTKSKTDTSTKHKDKDQESTVSIKVVEESDRNKRKKVVSRSKSSKVCKKDVVDDEKKFSSSCCIVKSTFDPCKDLKESMMEMIVDYNIRESKDLEKLLAFYLSLNSNEYHDMIVKAFEEVWLTFDFLV